MHPIIICYVSCFFLRDAHASAGRGGLLYCIIFYFLLHLLPSGKYLFLGKEAKQMKSQTGRENLLFILHMAALVIDSFKSGPPVTGRGRSIMSHSTEKGEGGGVGV